MGYRSEGIECVLMSPNQQCVQVPDNWSHPWSKQVAHLSDFGNVADAHQLPARPDSLIEFGIHVGARVLQVYKYRV